MSRRSGHAFSATDHLHLALGWGAGHAACHALFFFASLLPLTTGDGSYYPDACPGMSLFLVSALNCLGTGATLAASMVVALDGWQRRSVPQIVLAPAVHLASALLVGARGQRFGGSGGAWCAIDGTDSIPWMACKLHGICAFAAPAGRRTGQAPLNTRHTP